MDDRDPCPSLEILSGFCDGALDPTVRGRIEDHLERCADCLEAVSFWVHAVPAPPSVTRASRPWRRVAAAAAVLIACGGMAISLVPGSDHMRPVRDGTLILATGLRQGFKAGECLEPPEGSRLDFPDGTEVRAASGAALSLLEPRPGERLRLRLAHGAVELSAAREAGAVLVEASLGTARVAGTRFTVSLWPDPRAPRARAPSGGNVLLEVAVSEGAVEVSPGSAGRTLRLQRGERAYLTPTGEILGGVDEPADEGVARALLSQADALLRDPNAPGHALALVAARLRRQGRSLPGGAPHE